MTSNSIDFDQIYDVIIAGAGPAGCVLAGRLSETPSIRILLIEAGPDLAAPGAEHPDLLDPFCLIATENPAFHWPTQRVSVLSGSQALDSGLSRPFRQGFGVGGGSNMNGMAADRGLPDDYDEWCAQGAIGWNWSAVLPYFRKLEHDLDFGGQKGSQVHGHRGPIPVSRLPREHWAPFSAAVCEALRCRGYAYLEDYMSDFREGFGSVPTNCLRYRRVSASMAYLPREVRARSNLSIVTGARVDRVSFDGRRANGVIVRAANATRHIRGSLVVVACGAIQSPALLLRSGIGPGKALAELGISLVRDIPAVGTNLQNHPSLSVMTYLKRMGAQPADNPWFLQNWLRYSSHHEGCVPNDMHLIPINKCAWHALGRRVGMIAVTVLKPYSRGTVQLEAPDPENAPHVHFNMLGDSRDEQRLVGGLRLALQLLNEPEVIRLRHEVLQPRIGRFARNLCRRNAWNGIISRGITVFLDRVPYGRSILGGSQLDAVKSLWADDALRHYVRQNAHVQAHVCGTCRMGNSDDNCSVVDSAGRVHGVDALRVVDASIFPTLPRGYTHFIVMMVAEKLADSVKADLDW